MVLHRSIILLILVFFSVAILACHVQANSPQKELMTVKNQDTGEEILRNYLQLRLHNADWKEYSKFIGIITNKKANDIFCRQCVVACSL